MPVPGPAAGRVALARRPRRPAPLGRCGRDGRAGLGLAVRALRGRGDGPGASRAGTIWAGAPRRRGGRVPLCARTSVTRVDPVYLAEVPGAVVVADRATWAAWTSSRLDDHDSLHLCALLNPGFPARFRDPVRWRDRRGGVDGAAVARRLGDACSRALPRSRPLVRAGWAMASPPAGGLADCAWRARGSVAEGLVAAVAPLRDAGSPVELSLTGGKDSRLIAAALVKAGVPVVARHPRVRRPPGRRGGRRDRPPARHRARRADADRAGTAGRRARPDPRHRARRRRDAVRVRERRPP